MASDDVEIARLRAELAEAHETLTAIREGAIDAVVISPQGQHEVFTLQSSDLPFRELVEDMAEGVLSLDAAHTILFCNRSLARLLGQRRDHLVARSFMELLDLDSQHAFANAIGQGDVTRLACGLLHVDGSTVPVQLAITPPGHNTARRATVVVTDLRATQTLETVTRDRDEARAENRDKDTFLAMLGHELRNPLAALSSGVSLIVDEAPVDPRVRAGMQRQVSQLAALVDDLLDASRVARGKIALKREELRLADVVAHVTSSMLPVYDRKRHTLSVTIPPDLKIVADPVRLEQALVNLLTNAAKYSPPGAKVEVRARADERDVHIEVEDNGNGLSADDLERIFDPFMQVTVLSGGLGIGLTLVRQLVELHGGKVRVESPGLGKGSTFLVTMPRVELPRPAAAKPATAQSVAERSILLVDDHVDASEMMKLLLEAKGAKVTLCHLGGDAVGKALACKPAVVLLDIGLPDMPGYEVAHRLREAGVKARIVAITGFSDERTKQQIAAANFDGHLVKPVSWKDVLKLLD